MYPNHFVKGSPLTIAANSVANDSCYTYANIVYSEQSVALAIVIFTAEMLGLPQFFCE